MKLEIREADLSDVEIVYDLTKQAFQNYLDPAFSSHVPALKEKKDQVREDIRNKEVLLAYLAGQPVGTVRFYPVKNKIYHLSRLGVIDKFQGKNIGKELIEEVERQALEKGGKGIVLYSAYRNKELLQFYQSMGYQIIEVTDDDDYRRAKLKKELG